MTELEKEMYEKVHQFMNDCVLDLLDDVNIGFISYAAYEGNDNTITITIGHDSDNIMTKSITSIKNESITECLECYLDEAEIIINADTNKIRYIDTDNVYMLKTDISMLLSDTVLIIPEFEDTIPDYVVGLSLINVYNDSCLIAIQFKNIDNIEDIHGIKFRLKLHMIKDNHIELEELRREVKEGW